MTADITIARRASLSDCGTYRWTLERIWAATGDRVLFIGINPSTADAAIDDPTVRRWTHFAKSWGFGGFTAVNLYPYRTSSPKQMRSWIAHARRPRSNTHVDWHSRDAIMQNLDVIRQQAARAQLIVPCWGALAWDLDWVETVVERIFESTNLAEIHCLGTTAADAPMHPMARGKHRIPDDRQPILWRSL